MSPSALVCLVFLVSCFSYSYTQAETLIQKNPYWKQLPKNLTVGSMIYVTGRLKKDAKYFEVDLEHEYGQGQTSLLIRPSFKGMRTSVSSARNGTHYRLNHPKAPFPFKRGEWFTMIIDVLEEKYLVYVDGKKYFTFKPKFGYSTVQYLELKGDFSFLKPIVIIR